MTEFIRRCQNCGRNAQLSGPLCVGICYAAAKGKTGEEREKALREARERVARGDYRGGPHWDGSEKVEARQRKAAILAMNGVVLRLEIALGKGREIREEIDDHVRAWSMAFGYLPAALNRKVKGRFGKARELMTVPELERVKQWLGENYRVPKRREPVRVLTPVVGVR